MTTFIDERGFEIDIETGEVLDGPTPEPGFHVRDRASAEWVLQRMQELQAERLAIRARLDAVTENLNAQMREVDARLGFLKFRFGGQLLDWAREEISRAGPNAPKHVKTDFGRVGFRMKRGSIAVAEPEKAVEWAKDTCPEAVRIREELMVSRLPDEVRASVFEAPEQFDFLAVDTPREEGYIDTGVNEE